MNSLKRKLIDAIPRKFGFQCHALFSRGRALFHRGDKVYCPICDRQFRGFLPGGERFPILDEFEVVGQSFHEAGYCPRCYAADRERLLMLYLRDELKLFSADRRVNSMLHIAPEWTLRKPLLKCGLETYITGNLDPWLSDVSLDITDIPYPNKSFDLLMANHVLEHVPDDTKAMSEIRRVLKPGGHAILQVPLTYIREKTIEDKDALSWTDAERETTFGQRDHVRIYAFADYKRRLSDAGLTVNAIDWTTCSFRQAEKAVLNPNERLIVGTK